MVKHRQLARQVGAFGDFASESLMDLDNMIFSKGLTFVFGSWICKAGDDGKLQGRLLEELDHHQDHPISMITIDQLARRFTQLNPTQFSQDHVSDSNSSSASETKSYPSSFGRPSSFLIKLRDMTSTYQEYYSEYTQNTSKKLGLFPFGLHNMATSYQTRHEGSTYPRLRMRLKGA